MLPLERRGVIALGALGALGAVAAAGFELRTRSAAVDPASHLLLALNALVLGWTG